MTATSPYINDDLVNVFYTVDRTGLLSDDWYSAWVPGIVDPPSWYPFKIEGMRRIRSGPLAFLLLLLRTLQPIIDAETVPYCTIVDNADLERARELLALKWTPNPAIEILLSRVRSAMEKAEGVTHENYGLWARDEEVVLVNLLRKIFEISYRPTFSWRLLAERAREADRKLNGGLYARAQGILFGLPKKPSTPSSKSTSVSTPVRVHPPPPGRTRAEESIITLQAIQLIKKYDADLAAGRV